MVLYSNDKGEKNMEVLICFKDGTELKKENVKQVFASPSEDAIYLIYGPFSQDNFCLSEIKFYNIAK